VAPFDDTQLGLNKVAKYYYSPGWWQIGDQLDFIVNADFRVVGSGQPLESGTSD
jgi:TRAP-type mannitol/chloroaromatic compound transport system substrate-binding protein